MVLLISASWVAGIIYVNHQCLACCLVFETGSHYIAQAGLELLILLQPPGCWNYRGAQSCPASVFLCHQKSIFQSFMFQENWLFMCINVDCLLFFNIVLKNSFVSVLGAWTRGLHLEPLHQPFFFFFFCDGCFWDRVSRTIFLSWLRTVILRISASWVAKITGVSHWCPLFLFFFFYFWLFFFLNRQSRHLCSWPFQRSSFR
jgi:hypothetical protein